MTSIAMPTVTGSTRMRFRPTARAGAPSMSFRSALGLPDRDYYLKDEPVYRELRARYAAHIERLLKLAAEDDAAQAARSIVELETQIATAHWPRAKRRERDLTYNPHTREELTTF